MIPELFIQGILIGLFVSIPMGPIGVLCLQRTLQQGRLSGFISGLGAATADTVFASIAGLGLTMISDFFQDHQLYIMLVGAVLLIFLGLRMFFRNTNNLIWLPISFPYLHSPLPILLPLYFMDLYLPHSAWCKIISYRLDLSYVVYSAELLAYGFYSQRLSIFSGNTSDCASFST